MPALIIAAVVAVAHVPVVPLRHPRTLTPLSPVEVVAALETGHRVVFGGPPSPRRLAMATAQVFAENGPGTAVVNFNLGNVGAGEREPYHVIAGARFRAFQSAEEGAAAYWRIIRERCSGALRGFDDGSPSEAARRLRRCGFCRAPEETYRRALAQLHGQAQRVVATWIHTR